MLPCPRFGSTGEGFAFLPRCRRKVRPLTAKRQSPDLSDRRILIVEDSAVVGPFTADLLAELGCDVGPAPNMAAARRLIDSEKIHAALVDVHILGERVFPLCEALAGNNVPFALTSGYADWNMPEKMAGSAAAAEALYARRGGRGA